MKTASMKVPFFKRKNTYLLMSFVIPVLIMIGIFAGKGIYPFGDRSFLRTDMYHQYAPFFSEFFNKLKNLDSLSYSWNIGLGSNFISLLAYYLSSPFNWLLVLIPESLIIEFMTYLIAIKIGLCGLTMAYFLGKRNQSHDIGICFFAVFYALSGYMAAYSWNIMWLDCLLLAPLILWGLERLVKENKCFLYCITLGLAILTNYYIAIMICIFMVLYFIVLMIELPSYTEFSQEDDDGNEVVRRIPNSYGKRIFNFCFYSLLAGALSAVLLVPTIMALSGTASGNINFPSSLTSYFSVYEMLARHFVDVTVEIGLDHWANLYSGAAVLLFVPMYIMNEAIPFKKKITRLVLLLIMLVSFSFNIPNFIWHGLHFPNSLPARQSFLYTIVLLAVCYDAYKHFNRQSVKQLIGSFWLVVAYIFLCEKLLDGMEDFPYHVFYTTLAFVALYTLLLYLLKKGKATREALAVFTVIVIIIEATLNTAFTSVTTVSRTSYLDNTVNYDTVLDAAAADNDSFYRVEKSKRLTKNDAAWTGYPSASIFSSTTNANVTAFYKKVGMEGNTNAYCYQGATPFISSFLAVKYLIVTNSYNPGPLYELAYESEDVLLYENTTALSLGFMVPTSILDRYESLTGNLLEVQNQMATSMTGCPDIFLPISGAASGNDYVITVTEDQYVYLCLSSNSITDLKASYSYADITEETAITSTEYSNINRGYVADLGYCKAGTVITLTCEDEESKAVQGSAYTLNETAYATAMSILSSEMLEVKSYDADSVSGTITTAAGGLMLTSIPYEKGWSITVDGNAVEPQVYGDTFIALELKAGTHTIEMHYTAEGLATGALITLAAVLILGVLIVIYYVKKKKAVTNGSNTESRSSIIESRRQARLTKIKAAKESDTGEEEEYSELQNENDSILETAVPDDSITEALNALIDDDDQRLKQTDPEYLRAQEEWQEKARRLNEERRQKLAAQKSDDSVTIIDGIPVEHIHKDIKEDENT